MIAPSTMIYERCCREEENSFFRFSLTFACDAHQRKRERVKEREKEKKYFATLKKEINQVRHERRRYEITL